MVTALIEGSVGAGKTALAAKIALEANFPCVRLITPQSLVHHGECKYCIVFFISSIMRKAKSVLYRKKLLLVSYNSTPSFLNLSQVL